MLEVQGWRVPANDTDLFLDSHRTGIYAWLAGEGEGEGPREPWEENTEELGGAGEGAGEDACVVHVAVYVHFEQAFEPAALGALSLPQVSAVSALCGTWMRMGYMQSRQRRRGRLCGQTRAAAVPVVVVVVTALLVGVRCRPFAPAVQTLSLGSRSMRALDPLQVRPADRMCRSDMAGIIPIARRCATRLGVQNECR